MVFSSLIFLVVFLPIVLGLYYLIPGRGKNVILLLASIFFYAWGEPVYVVLMLFSCVFNYVCGLDIGNESGNKKFKLVFAVVVNLVVLGFFKYWGFLLETINAIPFINIPYHELALPVGISFYTFQAISYLVDVYRKDVEPNKNILDFSLYLSMFPQLVAGPIVKYHDIAEQLRDRVLSFENIVTGSPQFLRGLVKKVLIADTLGYCYTQICGLGIENLACVSAWIGIIAYTLQIYFDFSGYSDMAIGLGRMFGFEFQPNFNHPYISKSVTEFWRRWHMSLSTWFRDYVYIPLGGNRVSAGRHIFNMLVVWTLTGFWHGAAWNFIAWGFYYGVILIFEKYVTGKYIEMFPSPLRVIITLFVAVIGWVFFSIDSLGDALVYIGTLFAFGAGGGIADGYSLFYFQSYIIPIIIGAIFSAPAPGRFIEKLRVTHHGVWIALYVVAFVLSMAYMVSSSYSPFLYFRF